MSGSPGSEQRRIVEVVAWRQDGPALVVARHPGLAEVDVRLDDELAVAHLVETAAATLGTGVALLHMGGQRVDVEVLDPMGSASGLAWAEPNADDVLDLTNAWYRPGWFGATCSMLGELLAGIDATPVGPFVQQKHWGICAILSVDTDRGRFWFKQVPQFMAHEGRLTQWIAVRRPGLVPDVVALGDDWSLTRNFPSPISWSERNEQRPSPYGLLAGLQIEVGKDGCASDLLDLGCVDRRLDAIVDELRDLGSRPDLIDDDIRRRLAGALPMVEERAAELAAALPAWASTSLVHGDLHNGNWSQYDDGSWLIFDWTDGAVSHPFMDMGVLPTKDPALRSQWLDEYLGPWRDELGGAAVDEAWRLAEPLTGAFHAVSYQRIIDNLGREASDDWKGAVAWFATQLLDRLTPGPPDR